MSARILVTPRSLTQQRHPALRRLEEAGYELVFCSAGKLPVEEELRQLLPACVGYLCGVETVSERVLESARQLRVISRNGTGVDNVDLAAAQRRRIRVCRAEEANSRGVAELTVSLILALARSLPFCDARLKQGLWERRQGIELKGRTLGLIGFGRVGRLVAQYALAFEMNVLAFDPFARDAMCPSGRFEFVAMEALWPRADIISLHCPPAADGKPVIHPETISAMQPGVYIVNTARASLLDEAAVLKALDEGQLAGLAMDVFCDEPPVDCPLVHHPKVIATPHIGAFTRESFSRAVEAAVDNLLIALKNNHPSGTAAPADYS
jgi:D-3-phosphoglycerate dehydrogenase / 2-oxoglutarate reductase